MRVLFYFDLGGILCLQNHLMPYLHTKKYIIARYFEHFRFEKFE